MIKMNSCKRMALTLLSVFAMVVGHAQFNITATLPSGALYLRSQLWNLSISNTAGASVDVVLKMEMKDLQTHQVLLSAASAPFSVPQGVRVVQAGTIEPIQYYGPNTSIDRSPNGFLPVGQYQVCYQLFRIIHEGQTLAADDCEQVEVEPLSPPLLTMPENDSVLTTASPNFTWIPPAPATMFNDLNYDLSISEVHDGQSATDAIQNNLPLQQAQGLQQPFLSFPLQGPQLEKGKRYAWQIVARDQQRFATRSEVWTFRVGDKPNLTGGNNSIYLQMEGHAEGVGQVEGDTLHVKYVSAGLTHAAPIVFLDENGKIIYTLKREIGQGDNYFDLPLNGQFRSNNRYTVSITHNGKTSSLVFTIK